MIFAFFFFGLLGFLAYSSLSARIRTLEDALERANSKESEHAVADSLHRNSDEVLEEPSRIESESSADLPHPVIRNAELESSIGGKVFTAVGIIAVLFGMGFFLRYAFENNLISPVLRVALGFIASVVCIGLGEWLRKKYEKYGQALMGLGLGLAYLSWYATLHFYQLVNSPTAFIGMAVVTASGLVLSLRLNSVPLAVFAQIGGFLTPVLIGGTENQSIALFVYLLLLNVSMLLFVYLKSWREIPLVSIFGTMGIFISWHAHFSVSTHWMIPFLFMTLYFILFSMASLLRYFKRTSVMDRADMFILALNPLFYGIALYVTIPSGMRVLTGICFAILGVAYLAALSLIGSSSDRDIRYRETLAVIGSAFAAFAVPAMFDGMTILIAWAIIATSLIAWSYAVHSRLLLYSGHCMAFGSVMGAMGILLSESSTTKAWLNSNFINAVGIILCMAVAVWIQWKKEWIEKGYKVSSAEKNTLLSLILIEVHIFTGFALCHQVGLSSINSVWMIVIVAATSCMGVLIGSAMRLLVLRAMAYIMILISVVVFILFQSGRYIIAWPILNERFIAGALLIGLLMACWLICKKVYMDRFVSGEHQLIRGWFFLLSNFLGLYLLSTEARGWFDAKIFSLPHREEYALTQISLAAAKNATISGIWTIYAMSLLLWGILKKSRLARRTAIVLFSVAVLKVFLLDTATLNNLYRFVSFMILGVLLLLSGYLYHRFKERIQKFVS